MRLRLSIRGRDRRSVRPSHVIFEQRIWPFLRVKRSSYDIVMKGTMSDDDIHPRGSFFSFVFLLLFLEFCAERKEKAREKCEGKGEIE